MEWIKLAVRSLIRKGTRSFLTVLSIAVGVSSVVLISSIGAVGTESVRQEINGFGIGSLSLTADPTAENAVPLQNEHLFFLRSLSAVEQAVPVLSLKSTAQMAGKTDDVICWGIDAEKNQIIDLTLLDGRGLRQDDISRRKRVCLVDKSTAQRFYSRTNITGKHITLQFSDRAEQFEVIGVVDSGGNIMQNIVGEMVPGFVYLPYTALQDCSGSEMLDQIAVTLSEPDNSSEIQDRILRLLESAEKKEGTFRIQNVAAQKEQLEKILQIVTNLLSLIGGVSLIVAGIGVMTVMLSSVSERTKEIGIKKSIGASGKNIMMEFLLESLLLTVSGCVLGILFGSLLAWLGCMLLGADYLSNSKICLQTLFFSLLIGIVFGVYPSLQAAKMDPVEALRQE